MTRTRNVELAYMASFFCRSILFSVYKSRLGFKFVLADLKTILLLLLLLFNRISADPSGHAVCGRSPAEIVGSNSTGGMDVCLL